MGLTVCLIYIRLASNVIHEFNCIGLKFGGVRIIRGIKALRQLWHCFWEWRRPFERKELIGNMTGMSWLKLDFFSWIAAFLSSHGSWTPRFLSGMINNMVRINLLPLYLSCTWVQIQILKCISGSGLLRSGHSSLPIAFRCSQAQGHFPYVYAMFDK